MHKEKLSRWPLLIIGVAALLIVLWAFAVWGHVFTATEGAALFGDAFAPLTGLFTAAALVIAALSLRMQQLELRAQRQEFQASRVAQERLAHAQDSANALVAEQIAHGRSANELAAIKLRTDVLRMKMDLMDFAEKHAHTNWAANERGIREALAMPAQEPSRATHIIQAADRHVASNRTLTSRVRKIEFVRHVDDTLDQCLSQLHDVAVAVGSGSPLAVEAAEAAGADGPE